MGRYGQFYSHNREYQRANTDLLFQIRFISCAIVSPFIIHYFLFSLSSEHKGEILWKRCRWIVWLILLCHANGQKHIYLIASSIKIIYKSNVLLCTDSNQPKWFHVETYLCILGLRFADTAASKIIIKHLYDDRLVDCFCHVLIHITFYA